MQQYISRFWHLAGAVVGSMGFLALVEGEETRLVAGSPGMMGVGRLVRSSPIWAMMSLRLGQK